MPNFPGAKTNAEVNAKAISADGTTVVGSANYGGKTGTSFSLDHAFRWTQATGTVDIDGRGHNTASSIANAVSDDGSVVVGAMSSGSDTHAFRWTQASGVMQDLGTKSNAGDSTAYGVSGDGSTVVGQTATNGDHDNHAFTWTNGSGFTDLGTLPTPFSGHKSAATAANYDGSVVVGWSDYDDSTGGISIRAVRWDHGSISELGALSNPQSFASAVSADGTVVVGTTEKYDNYRTTGHFEGTERAFRWTQATGMKDLKTLLSNGGLNMNGITLLSADGLSKDGIAIVGQAMVPGSTTPTGYLVTYIDPTNYDVAKNEGAIAAIDAAASGSGFTTTSSVSVSMGELGAAQQALFSEEKTFNALLGGTFDPLLGGGNHIGVTAAAGSTTIAIHGSGQVNDHFTLFGGLGYGNRDYSHATIESPVTVAAGLRWFPDVMGAARPFAEVGGFVSPAQNDTFERVYANGAGTATGTGFTHSTLAEAYIKGGVVLAPTKKMQLALSADIGEGVFSYDGYSEAATGNPLPATFSGATNTATLVHGEAKLNWTVNDHVKLGLNMGVGHSIGRASVSGTVSSAPYSGSGGDVSWINYGADVAFHLNKRTSLDAFVIGESGDQGTGSHLQAGIDLRAVF